MKLSDQQLLEAYDQALKLELEDDFISVLKEEMIKRNLEVDKDIESY
ncbi:sporulation histidine kinase inhibitor Sda [Halalkalibacterium halodurans]|uniref:BH1452 protein n=1 Tax=Halalkalibacterium halodurans (strain ATCC BAA-125 / DSM 18197 / FERM 7344 / JCM 9153 / C-125) TaxID=272558 RepID=Q9KCW7_HALH5|nr:sporulation histidine kinase inhibitor Sda [Halalkalibacterium halodurans]MED4082865.1 sporulation histidine kinase inhibitor Sda [Halalkalibacterium halodurans]MED4084751.1 sporulation histidine kinase inhibitor Sda [Halalkalibacterium halodurans]MED4106141.1 sporulation histidine kinase inhibitor Sda [Halalkalibacterium halodurans]MED4110666.1 sporulation histidine kinase inhibitor Sda [Halalkalibacterium halodurans]MED4124646.1 sporulation histidine kinase inhibitor Sda [Halalkalibacteri